MEKRIIAVFENRIAKILNFGPDRIFIRITENDQICGSSFEEATKFDTVQTAINALCTGIRKKSADSDLSIGSFRIGLLKNNGKTVDWLTRENHPVPFIFMDCTSSLNWTFESDDGEFKDEYSARFVFSGKIPEIASASSLKEILENRAPIRITKFEVSYDYKKPEAVAKLKWIERN